MIQIDMVMQRLKGVDMMLRDELIAFEQLSGEDASLKTIGRIGGFLDGYQKAMEKQQWIPCSERLPEEDGDYLVCYEEGYRKDYGFSEIGIAPYEVDAENFGVWTEEFDLVSMGSLGSEFVEIDVDAWMPLPEPYKGENDG